MSTDPMVARDYEDYWSDLKGSHAFHPGNQFRYRTIIRELKRLNIQPKTVIDCGCGDGSLIFSLRESYPNAIYYGTDVADNVPANTPQSGIRFFRANLGAPVNEDLKQKFDLVVCSEVIEHVEDDNSVLQNLVAIAKPGAIIVLTTQSGNMYRAEQYLGHIRHYNLGDLSRRFAAAGADILRSYTCGWPLLNLQKLVAHYTFPLVRRVVVEPRKPSAFVRVGMAALTPFYLLSSRSAGPQIVITASRNRL